jgi:uncharacterized protein (TIGR02145 family)
MRKRLVYFLGLLLIVSTMSLTFNGCSDPTPKYPPKADFRARTTATIARDTITLFDLSTNVPTGWFWSFPGAVPAMSKDKRPIIRYEKAGVYTVSLLTYNMDGSSDITKKSYITITYKTGTFTDTRDNRVYKTIVLGDQTWMAENLDYNMTNSWYYDGDATANKDYGRLYNYDAALLAAPAGWHLPSQADWVELIKFLGSDDYSITGSYMKEKGTAHWTSPNVGDSNSIGFNGLPGGFKPEVGNYGDKGLKGYFWSADPISDQSAYYYYLSNNDGAFRKGNIYKLSGLSIRCVKDN